MAEAAAAPRWPACFHAQQTAEKALKALLVARGTDFPFSHALDRLADLIGEDALSIDPEQLVALQPWAVAGRYPEDVTEPGEDEVSRLVGAAAEILAAVERAISSVANE